jgi:hypothetical protein
MFVRAPFVLHFALFSNVSRLFRIATFAKARAPIGDALIAE